MTEKKLKVMDLDTPPEILIKTSQVEPHKYGIWCKQLIKEGTKFGPFVGEKAYEVDETMDPAFIWEIVDVETKEFLFYINATNPRYGNWMRHINCARYFEEQNIVSEQEGIDIFYHAIKDIHPGDELLTWYEKSPVRKKKGKKKIFPNVKRARTGDESKVASRSVDHESVSLRGRKRTARKFWEMEEIGGRLPSTVDVPQSGESEDELPSTNLHEDDGDDDDDEDWDLPKFGSAVTSPRLRALAGASNAATATTTTASSALNSGSSGHSSPFAESSRDSPLVNEAFVPAADKEKTDSQAAIVGTSGSFFIFENMVEQGGSGGSSSSTGGLWKNGRRVFRCDICSGVYRHSFSLKRHYVRCHVNYKYLTRVDIIQCGVQPPKFLSEGPERADVDNNESHQEAKTTELECNVSSPLLMDCTLVTVSDTSDSCRHAKMLPSKDLDLAAATQAEEKYRNNTTDTKVDTCSLVAPVSSASLAASASVVTTTSSVVVHGGMPDLYKCNVCELFFDTKDEIRKHLTDHPESEGGGHHRQFSCSNCNMQFKHKQNLVRHEVVHTGAKPFSCQQCHKSFPTATNQKRHEKIHDGHRLTCDLCPATFTQTGDLKKHACKQHPESYNECAYCSKYFSSESDLDNHLSKAHGKDVEANRRRVCDKKKAKKVVLEKDRAESRRLAVEEFETRGHGSAALVGAQEGEESYACTVCRKCFYNYSNMCRHRRLAHYKDSKTDDIYGLGIDDDDDDLQGIINSNGNHNVTAANCNNQQHQQQQHQQQLHHQSSGVVTRSSSAIGAEMGYKQVLMVARNVTKNLELFIEGTRNDLDKASSHIRWKQKNHTAGDFSEVNVGLHSGGGEIGMELHLEDFNFPKGYQMPCSILPVMIGLKENPDMKSNAIPGETSKEEVLSDAQKMDPSIESLKNFSKSCNFCRMNFADPNGYEKHSLECPPTSDIPPGAGAANGNGSDCITLIHDYSRKSKPTDLAVRKFPELAKLPSQMFSEEAILDLSRHKDCVFASLGTGHVSNELRYPCKVNSEKPLDLTGCLNDLGHMSGSQTSSEVFSGMSAVSVSKSLSEAHPSCQSVTGNKSTPTKSGLNISQGSFSNITCEIDQSCILRTPRLMRDNLSLSFQEFDDVFDREMTPGKKAVCLVCYKAFPNRDAVVDHQEIAHPNVDCRHAEVEAAYDITWPRAPNPVGQLNVVVRQLFETDNEELKNYMEVPKEGLLMDEKTNTTEIPAKEEEEVQKMVIVGEEDEEDSKQEGSSDTSLTEDSASQTSLHMEVATEVDDSEFVTCTKCRQRFHGLEALHNHISDLCGDYWRSLNERVSWVFVLRGSEIPVTPTQSGGASQPRKRGKFKWQQMSSASHGAGGLSRTSNGGVGDDSSKKQQQSSIARNGSLVVADASRKIGHSSNKVLTRKRSQEIGASVMSAMDDPDYYVRSKRRAIMQQQGHASAAVSTSRKNSRRQAVGDAASQAGLAVAVGAAANGGIVALDFGDAPANCSMDEDSMSTLLLQDASDLGVANGEDDDDDDYDPSKFMCIYCRHQFQYTRTLRKHVLEFCHVRREFAEKGDYLDLEWEEELMSKVQPPMVPQPTQLEAADDPEETKRSGGKRKRKRNWYNRSNSNNSSTQNQVDTTAIKSDDRQHKPLPVHLQLPPDMVGDTSQRLLALGRGQSLAPVGPLTGSIVVNNSNQKMCSKDDFVMVSCDSIPSDVCQGSSAPTPTASTGFGDSFIHVEIYSTAPQGSVQPTQTAFPQQAQHQLVLQKQLLLPSQQPKPATTSESTATSSSLVIPSTRSLVLPQVAQEKGDDEDGNDNGDDEDCCTESPTSAILMMTVSSSASSYSSDENKNQFQSSPKGEGQKTGKKRRGPRLTMVKRKKKSLATSNQPGSTEVDQPIQTEADANASWRREL